MIDKLKMLMVLHLRLYRLSSAKRMFVVNYFEYWRVLSVATMLPSAITNMKVQEEQ